MSSGRTPHEGFAVPQLQRNQAASPYSIKLIFWDIYVMFTNMSITQTVEITADRRITLEVPRETPIGKASVEYKIIPFDAKKTKQKMSEAEEMEYINKNIEWLTKEALDNISFQNTYLDTSE
jgi:2-methylcitrate dehydratase PrpD